MTPATRLAASGSPLDRRLLRAARNDRPPPGAEEAALVALGTHAVLQTGTARAAAPTSHARSLAGKLGFVKVLLTVMATCGAGVVAWAIAHGATGSSRAPAVGLAAVAVAKDVASRGSPAEALPVEAVTVATVPRESVTVPAVPLRARTVPELPRPSASREASELALEVVLVQRAAQALVAGDADAALAALDDVRSRCKRPVLVPEAGLLRARALAMRGQTSEAAALARRMGEADPRGVLARRFAAIADADAGAVP